MASQAPSSSPAHAPTNVSSAAIRRSFTLPARAANKPPPPASQTSSDGIETLFVCASTKIVSFTASASRRTSPSRRRSPNRGDAPTLSWRSATERTLAFGPLRIYRVTSSNVSFLNSGNLLHTIFPRSQCWCVDGQSIFVLRIRQDAYYRIELPHETTEDTEKVSDFRSVLGHVLQYERTRCPFTRGFEVELPERPKTPPRKVRPRKPAEKAKKWTFDKTWMPENDSRPCTPVMEGSDAGTASSYEEDDASSICTDRSEVAPDTPATQIEAASPRPALQSSPAPAPRLPVSERAKMFQGGRSVTAPITQQRHRLSISSEAIPEYIQTHPDEGAFSTKPQLERHESTGAQSLASTTDSFYSFETSTERTPTPPFLDAHSDLINPWTTDHTITTTTTTPNSDSPRGRTTHKRHPSEMTLRPSSPPPLTPTSPPKIDIQIHSSPTPSTPPLTNDSDSDTLSLDACTPPTNTANATAPIRLKRLTGASQKRAFSPMPHPQNLFLPQSSSAATSSSALKSSSKSSSSTAGPAAMALAGTHFTSALIRRTAEIVLGPPAHLVSLMLRIAERVRDGVFEFGFGTYRVGGRGREERVPGGWFSEDEGEDGEDGEGEDWGEMDDFGIPLRGWESRDQSRGRGGGVD